MSTYPQRRGELVQTPGQAGWTVYEPNSDSLHVLNQSALAVWELCDGHTAPAEMVAAIVELTGLSVADAERDVADIIGTLNEVGLVIHV